MPHKIPVRCILDQLTRVMTVTGLSSSGRSWFSGVLVCLEHLLFGRVFEREVLGGRNAAGTLIRYAT